MTEQEFIAACMAYDGAIHGLTAIQPQTGITAELTNGIAIIRRAEPDKQIWKTTQSPELLERFMSSLVDIINPKDLKPFTGNIQAYKATEKAGKIIPGFVTGDLEYAKSWANEGAEFGGGIIVTMNISRADGRIKEAIILSVADNDIIIPPGSPNVIDYAGDGKTEILVLRPTQTTQMQEIEKRPESLGDSQEPD